MSTGKEFQRVSAAKEKFRSSTICLALMISLVDAERRLWMGWWTMIRECLAIIMCVLVEKRSISQRHTNDLTLRAVWLNYHVFSVKFAGMYHCLCWQWSPRTFKRFLSKTCAQRRLYAHFSETPWVSSFMFYHFRVATFVNLMTSYSFEVASVPGRGKVRIHK